MMRHSQLAKLINIGHMPSLTSMSEIRMFRQSPPKVNLDRTPVGCLQLGMHFLPLGMRFLPLYLALACAAVLTALDVVVRLRLRKVGEQSRPFQGGLFNHAKYLRLQKQHQWSGWPVYLSWAVWLGGIVILLWNLLFNTVPRRGF